MIGASVYLPSGSKIAGNKSFFLSRSTNFR